MTFIDVVLVYFENVRIVHNVPSVQLNVQDCASTLSTKWTHFYGSCRLYLSEYGIEHGLEHTQNWDVPCSSMSTIPYSASLVNYVEYEHGVKARLERGI